MQGRAIRMETQFHPRSHPYNVSTFASQSDYGQQHTPRYPKKSVRVTTDPPQGKKSYRSRKRPSTTQRGYGSQHMKERKRFARIVEAGGAFCSCGGWIAPGSDWHLGHDHRNGGYLGPEHARCNIRDRNKRHARPKVRSEVW